MLNKNHQYLHDIQKHLITSHLQRLIKISIEVALARTLKLKHRIT